MQIADVTETLPLSHDELLERWQTYMDDPALQDSPYRVELDAYGRLMLLAATEEHESWQKAIEIVLYFMAPRVGLRGLADQETGVVTTSMGIRRMDVTFLTVEEIMQPASKEKPRSPVPMLCFEVMSRSNTKQEMADKRAALFEDGCQEAWTVTRLGTIHFSRYDAAEEQPKSRLFPEFPSHMDEVLRLRNQILTGDV